jgi:threonine/homoserine/homoserine lactone efflux protein
MATPTWGNNLTRPHRKAIDVPTHVPVFLITTWLLAMLPGAGQAFMIRQALAGGTRDVRAAIAGHTTGLLIWSSAAAAGLSAVLLADPGAYQAIRVAGGVVLVVLGINTLRASGKEKAPEPGPGPEPTGDGPDPARAQRRGAYLAGLGTALGNPKAGVFAISVLPQFVTAHGPVALSSVALGAVWALVNVCWYLLFTWAVARGRALVSRPAVLRRLSVVTGIVLLALGVAVAGGV